MPNVQPPGSDGILDPQDWEAFRKLGYQAVDEAILLTRSLRSEKVWRPIPPASKVAIRRMPTEEGMGDEAMFGMAREHILPYRFGNVHPRYWSRMGGSGFLLGSLADFLSSAMNSNTAGQESSGVETEEAVLVWLKQLLNLPEEGSAVLTSGCSAAHIIGLTVCRNQMSGFDVNDEGLAGAPSKLVFYCSDQTHNCIDKAVALIGIGISQLRKIPCSDSFQLDLDKLQQAVDKDRLAGLKPACVIGNAGTLSTGAVDDLNAIAEFCQRQDMWFHVDGAFGAFAVLSETLRPQLAGMERADSLAVDLHKWLQMPYDIGCVFVKDPIAHRKAFTNEAAYLASTPRGPAASKARFFELGLDLSRNCKALKVWMGLTSFGIAPFRKVVEQNVEQAKYVAERVKNKPGLELSFEPNLNVVCFRAVGSGSAEKDDALNDEIALRIQEEGLALLQTIPLRGCTVLRLGIVNHRSVLADFDLVIDEVVRVSQELLAKGE